MSEKHLEIKNGDVPIIRSEGLCRISSVIFPVFIGVISFLLIYGVVPLDPQNDAWIMAGYDETDIIQHYSGWLAFRDSAWRFPLGMAEKMAVGDGTIISYTDSIPWVAIFFKLFRRSLPATFQYFEIYTLFCYILQAIAAYKILFFKTADKTYSMIGTLLFSFAPIFIERAFRHTALGSQWLILSSIAVYLRHRERASKHTYVSYLILGVLAIGIHPYFLPMIFCFSLLCTYKDVRERKWQSVGAFLAGLAVTYLAGCMIGVLGREVNVSREGFGYYSMNLNAILNPTSRGGYDWSSLLKVHPQILGNYDGFNYLGAGILVLTIMVMVIMFETGTWKRVLILSKKELPLLLVMSILVAYAVSNVGTFNAHVLFTCPLPESMLKLCGIFRASSRMFYPIYYMLYIVLLLLLWRWKGYVGRRKVLIMLSLVVSVQFLDIYQVILQKHQMMGRNAKCISLLQDETLAEVAQKRDALVLDGFEWDKRRVVATWALKNGLDTYFSTANSGSFSICASEKEKLLRSIFADRDLGDTIIATTDIATLLKYLRLPCISAYIYDDVYYIYKVRDDTEEERSKMVYLGELVIDASKDNVILADLSDGDWEYGVNKNGHVLRFKAFSEWSEMFHSARRIICGKDIFVIKSVIEGDRWIEVTVDRDAYVCRYPRILQIE